MGSIIILYVLCASPFILLLYYKLLSRYTAKPKIYFLVTTLLILPLAPTIMTKIQHHSIKNDIVEYTHQGYGIIYSDIKIMDFGSVFGELGAVAFKSSRPLAVTGRWSGACSSNYYALVSLLKNTIIPDRVEADSQLALSWNCDVHNYANFNYTIYYDRASGTYYLYYSWPFG